MFDKDEEVIIIDYDQVYFEICQNSICGYINEVRIHDDIAITKFINLKKAGQDNLIYSDYSNFLQNASNIDASNKTSVSRTKKNIIVQEYILEAQEEVVII